MSNKTKKKEEKKKKCYQSEKNERDHGKDVKQCA